MQLCCLSQHIKSLKSPEIPVMHAEEEGEMSEADGYELALFVDS